MKNLSDKINGIPVEGIFEVERVWHDTGERIDYFKEKNIIVLDAKEAIIRSISSTSNFGVIEGLKIGDDYGSTVNMLGAPLVTFFDSNPDTLTRSAGSWIDDGFIEEMTITVSNTTSNNTTYTIDTVTDTTLTLIPSDTVTAEGPVAAVISGAPSANNPIPPLETFNESSMNIVYTYPSALTIGYGSATSVTFSATLIGSEVLSLYPGQTTKRLNSAALHTGSGKVFAYKRYPQKSISDLIDININWTIQY